MLSADGCSNTTVQANGTCTVQVAFNAKTSSSGDSQGNYQASLSIDDNATNSPQTAQLSAGPRTASLSPSSATIYYGPGGATSFTLTNYGPGPLDVTGVGVSPGHTSPDMYGFNIDPSHGCGALPTLQAGQSCTLTVTASSPQSGGCNVTNGTATIDADAQGSPFTASLTGECIPIQ